MTSPILTTEEGNFITRALQRIADDEAAKHVAMGHVCGAWFELLSTRRGGGEIQVRFIADLITYNLAQSGSNWYDQRAYVGNAVFVNGQLATHSLEQRKSYVVVDGSDETPEPDRAYMLAELRKEIAAETANKS